MARNTKTPPAAARVHLIYGDDAYRVAAEAEALVHGLVPPAERALGLELLDGRVDTVPAALDVLNQCREAILTPGFMGGRKTVWLREASFLGADVLGRSKEVGAAVAALAAAIRGGLPDGHTLAISAPAVEAKSPLLEACREAGGTLSAHAAVKPWDQDKAALALARESFAARGLKADAGALDALVRVVGGDLRVYASELEKLALSILPRTRVTERDVLDIASPDRESDGLEFQDAVGRRDLEAALAHARRLSFQKAAPIQLITGLYSRFRTLALLADLMAARALVVPDRGAPEWRDPDGRVAALLADACGGEKGGPGNPMKMNPYRVGLLAQQARQFAPRELGSALGLITAAREELVSSRRPEDLLMDLLLIRICRRPRR